MPARPVCGFTSEANARIVVMASRISVAVVVGIVDVEAVGSCVSSSKFGMVSIVKAG